MSGPRRVRWLPARGPLATPACAETPLDAAAFAAPTRGRTMPRAACGQVHGVEHAPPDRRARWSVLGQDCRTGHWHAKGPVTCFRSGDRPDPAGRKRTPAGRTLHARLRESPTGTAPVVIEDIPGPLACPGPMVGA